MEEQRHSPSYFVLVSAAGGWIAASAWFVPFGHLGHTASRDCGFWAGVWSNRLLDLAISATILVGMPLALWAQRRLRRGFLNDVWTEAELTRARLLLAKPVWRWASFAVFALALLQMAFFIPNHSTRAAFFYLLFFPTQMVTEMRRMLAPRVERTDGLGDWRNFKPIQSAHWGEPVSGSG